MLMEQVERLSHLYEADRIILTKLQKKNLPEISYILLCTTADEVTRSVLKAINAVPLDMLAAVARKDDQGRRRRHQAGKK